MTEPGFVQQIVDSIQRGDADSYARLFAEDAVLHHPLAPAPVHGRDAIRDSEKALFDAFSDVEVEVASTVTEGPRVAVEVLLRATNSGPIDMGNGQSVPATGRRIEVASAWFFEVDSGGLVIAERDYFDAASLMAQLGLDG